MDLEYNPDIPLLFPAPLIDRLVAHCRKNLEINSQSNNNIERKAYGLLAGRQSGTAIEICRCFPLLQNARSREPFKSRMDLLMANHAIVSETPLDHRGWVADPEELMEKIHQCHSENIYLLGPYHTPRVAWSHDPIRDTPTKIDAVLAKQSRMFMVIVSMVNPASPIIRAFYEGITSQEYPIIYR